MLASSQQRIPAPCLAASLASSHPAASAVNRQTTGKGLTIQAWCIAGKIKQVDDAITPESQPWAFEVHPEVCSWALNKHHPILHKKTSRKGVIDRLTVLKTVFPEIEHQLLNRVS